MPVIKAERFQREIVLAGEEALTPQAQKDAADNGWSLVKGFPLYRYRNLAAAPDHNVDPLPPGVSISAIYTDYMSYLTKHTARWFAERILDGRNIWKIHSKDMTVVFIEPEDRSTQDEAFLQACLRDIKHANIGCDIRVTTEGMAYALAYASDFDIFIGFPQEDVDKYLLVGAKDFELNAMRSFRSSKEDYSIEIAKQGFHNASMRTRRGRMALNGQIIAGFFEPCVSAILAEVLHHKKDLDHILLTRDFANRQYIVDRLSEKFGQSGCRIPNNITNIFYQFKGALIHGTSNLARVVSTVSLGILIGERYDQSNLAHRGRKIYHGHGGHRVVSNRWSEIVKAGTSIDPTSPVRRRMVRSLNPSRDLTKGPGKYICYLWSFDGKEKENSGWAKNRKGNVACMPECVNKGFRKVCRVEAEFTEYNGTLTRKYKGKRSKDALEMFLVIGVSGLQLEAHIEWDEKVSEDIRLYYLV
ncbi:hypothetical protein FRC06_009952 [Ceratobasidium sp. 370]|nr:hypothetical protein FRC06_009952 [Ceratobasidium sp. 370]